MTISGIAARSERNSQGLRSQASQFVPQSIRVERHRLLGLALGLAMAGRNPLAELHRRVAQLDENGRLGKQRTGAAFERTVGEEGQHGERVQEQEVGDAITLASDWERVEHLKRLQFDAQGDELLERPIAFGDGPDPGAFVIRPGSRIRLGAPWPASCGYIYCRVVESTSGPRAR